MTQPTPDRPLIVATSRFRNAILAKERASAVRLVNAYGRAYARIQGDITALQTVIAELGDAATWGQVQRLSLYRSLMSEIRREINRFGVIAENEINEGARGAIVAGLADSQRAIQIALPSMSAAEVKGLVNTLVPDQVETMLGFLSQDSPLYQNLRTLGDDVATLVSQKLSEGIILGMSPRLVAREIVNATGQGLTWSLNTARTSQLWAYREASRSNYLANSHVVKGWVWWAELGDPRTCMSCVAMHGTEHTLNEALDDHHAGRCAMLPVTLTAQELGLDVQEDRPPIQKGEDWFKGLPRAQQSQLMGATKFKAWQAGEFQFSQLSEPYQNDVYGQMRREASLKGMIGDRARDYYKSR